MLVTAPTASARPQAAGHAADLVGQPFVLFEAGSNSRKTIEVFFAQEQIAPKVVTETENVEIIKALVMVGMGVAIIPYQAVAREVRTGQLFCARIAGQQLVRETGWVHLRLNRVPRAVQEMMRMFEQDPAEAEAVARPAGARQGCRVRRARGVRRSRAGRMSGDVELAVLEARPLLISISITAWMWMPHSSFWPAQRPDRSLPGSIGSEVQGSHPMLV